MAVDNYFVIAGTTKAATSSVFTYLADHPETCPSNTKETRFFYNGNYDLHQELTWRDGADHFEEYFACTDGEKIKVEATPDYLYSSSTPALLKEHLKRVKVLLILRNPVDRLLSWYKFAIQIGVLEPETSFDDYIEKQKEASNTTEQHLLALEQGRYSNYLSSYRDCFSDDELMVIGYSAVGDDAQKTMKAICRFIGISEDFYDTYTFQVFNQSQRMKNLGLYLAYRNTRNKLRKIFRNSGALRKGLQKLRRIIEPLVFSLNQDSGQEISLSEDNQRWIDAYYSEELQKVRDIINNQSFIW